MLPTFKVSVHYLRLLIVDDFITWCLLLNGAHKVKVIFPKEAKYSLTECVFYPSLCVLCLYVYLHFGFWFGNFFTSLLSRDSLTYWTAPDMGHTLPLRSLEWFGKRIPACCSVGLCQANTALIASFHWFTLPTPPPHTASFLLLNSLWCVLKNVIIMSTVYLQQGFQWIW